MAIVVINTAVYQLRLKWPFHIDTNLLRSKHSTFTIPILSKENLFVSYNYEII